MNSEDSKMYELTYNLSDKFIMVRLTVKKTKYPILNIEKGKVKSVSIRRDLKFTPEELETCTDTLLKEINIVQKQLDELQEKYPNREFL